jgi:tetratricopeptide (TPR) repeat protein
VDKALALNPRLLSAHRTLGFMYREELKWNESLAEYRKAYALEPTNADANFSLGLATMVQGDVEAALPLFQKGIGLDPINAQGPKCLAYALYALGKLPDAEAAARRALDLDPAGWGKHWVLGQILLLSGQPEMAVKVFQREPYPHGRRTGMALAYAASVASRTLISRWPNLSGWTRRVARTR